MAPFFGVIKIQCGVIYSHVFSWCFIPLYKNFIPCKNFFHTFKFLFSYLCGLVSYLGHIFQTFPPGDTTIDDRTTWPCTCRLWASVAISSRRTPLLETGPWNRTFVFVLVLAGELVPRNCEGVSQSISYLIHFFIPNRYEMHLKNKTIDTGTKTPYLGMKKNHGCTEPDNFIPYFFNYTK